MRYRFAIFAAVVEIAAVGLLALVGRWLNPELLLAIVGGGSCLGVVSVRLLGWHERPARWDPSRVLAISPSLESLAAAVAGNFTVLTALATKLLIDIGNGSPDHQYWVILLWPIPVGLAIMTALLVYVASPAPRRRPPPPDLPGAHLVGRGPDAAKMIHLGGSKVIHPEPRHPTPSGGEVRA